MEKEVMYHAEITLCKAHGWSQLTAVRPSSAVEQVQQEALEYLHDWPKYSLRIVQITKEVIHVLPGLKEEVND